MAVNSSAQIAVLVERLGRLARGLQHRGGTKPVQWEVLRYLQRANRISRNPGALADFLGSTRGTVSQTLITLEKKGLLVRSPSRFDGRGMEVELTEAGRKLIADNPLREIEAAAETLSGLDVLADSLSELLGELQKRNGYRAFGKCHSCDDFETNHAAGDGDDPFRCGVTGVSLSELDSHQICFKHTALPVEDESYSPVAAE